MPSISFAGIASGLDTEALIRSTLQQQRQLSIGPITKRIQELRDVNDAIGGLSTLASDLRRTVEGFRVVGGGAVGKRFSSSSEGVATGAASNGAGIGTFEITVQSLAKQGVGSFTDRFNSPTGAVAAGIDDGASAENRSISITFGEGDSAETVSVAVTSTTSATDIVDAVNEKATQGSAALVNQGTASSPSYAIVFSSKESGVERGAISLTAGAALTNTGAFTSSTTSQATDATFSLSGLGGTVRRSSNTVSDILPGVTLNLGSLGTTTISVKTDSSKTAKGVADFVDRFNRIVSYTKEQNTVTFESDSKDTTPTFAPLSSTQIDEGLVSAIRSTVQSSRSGRNSAIATLADMGITTARDGTLSLDSKKLDAAIANDSGSVEKLLQQLGDTLAAPGGAIAQFTRFGGQFDALKQANNRQIDSYNRRAESAEKILSRQEDEMRTRFSRLESLMGGLQQQQMALSSLVRR